MRLTSETRAALDEAKCRTGASSMDEFIKSLLDGSAMMKLLGTDYPSRADEISEMGMLTSKMLEMFKSSWTLSRDSEARVTQEMKRIVAEKDDSIAALKSQLEESEATRAELQEHIEKLNVELDMMRRERDVALMRADTLAQANELSELIKAMQSAAKTVGAAEPSGSNAEQDEPSAEEDETEELSPEDVDSLDEYDNRHPTVGAEPPF